MKLVAAISILATLALATPVSRGSWECTDADCSSEVAVGTAELHYPALRRSVFVPDGTTFPFTADWAPRFEDVASIEGATVADAHDLDEGHFVKRVKRQQKCMDIPGPRDTAANRRKYPGCMPDSLLAMKKSAHNCKGNHYWCCRDTRKLSGRSMSIEDEDNRLGAEADQTAHDATGLEARGRNKNKKQGDNANGRGKQNRVPRPAPTGTWGPNRHGDGHVLRVSKSCVCNAPSQHPGEEMGWCYA